VESAREWARTLRGFAKGKNPKWEAVTLERRQGPKEIEGRCAEVIPNQY